MRNSLSDADGAMVDDEALQQNDHAATYPASHNPYAAQYPQSAAQPNLDAAVPELANNDLRRLNRRALGFLAGIVLMVATVALWVFSSLLDRGESAKKPNEEVVTIPAAPQLTLSPQALSSRPAESIAVAPSLTATTRHDRRTLRLRLERVSRVSVPGARHPRIHDLS